MLKLKIIFLLTFSVSFAACSQNGPDTTPARQDQSTGLPFAEVAKGVHYCEIDAPDSSILGDSKLTILKLDPKVLDFELFTASNRDRKPLPADQWAQTLDCQIVFNAGMYDLAKPLTARGYMKNGTHFNQPAVKEGWNSVIVMNPADKSADCKIVDLQQTPVSKVKNHYGVVLQSLRMLDAGGNPTYWKKKPQSCSMLLAAEDEHHNFYLIFTRSPYTHNTMIDFLRVLPVNFRNAIYLEGGPETSLYVNIGDFSLKKFGSYVSGTYAHDKNDKFWALPNVIGIKVQQ